MDYPLQRLVLRRLRVVASALAPCFGLSDAYTKGGASIWQTQTIDPELGLIYFSTGNAHPDFNEGKPDPVTTSLHSLDGGP